MMKLIDIDASQLRDIRKEVSPDVHIQEKIKWFQTTRILISIKVGNKSTNIFNIDAGEIVRNWDMWVIIRVWRKW